MTLVDELRSLERRVTERLAELEPLVAEHVETRRVTRWNHTAGMWRSVEG